MDIKCERWNTVCLANFISSEILSLKDISKEYHKGICKKFSLGFEKYQIQAKAACISH